MAAVAAVAGEGEVAGAGAVAVAGWDVTQRRATTSLRPSFKQTQKVGQRAREQQQ